MSRPKEKAASDLLPTLVSWYEIPLQSRVYPLGRSTSFATRCRASRACPEHALGAAAPNTKAVLYPLKCVTGSGPLVYSVVTTVSSGIKADPDPFCART